MFNTYHIFVIHSCPEDQSSIWINIKHSEVREILRECFPGVSGRSWTVAFAVVRLCSQPRWSRCTAPSSPLPITHLCIFCQVCQLLEERRMDLSCLCVVRQAVLSAFSQLDGTLQHALSKLAGMWCQFNMWTAFASLPWNIEGKARLYRCARKMSVMRLFSWQIDWLFSSPLIRSHSPSRINKIYTYFCQTNP